MSPRATAPRRTRRRNALAALMVSCVMLSTVACGSTDDGSTSTPGDGTIEVESCGHTVTLDAPAQSVVVIGAGSVDTLFEMGVGDRITGVVRVFADPAPKYAAQLEDLPDIGDALPGREALLALQPDLVIAEQGRTLSGEEGTPSIEQLEEAGIAAYVVSSGCDNNPVNAKVTDTFAEIEKFGTLLGASEGAHDLIGRLQRQLDDTTGRVEDREPVDVAYISLVGSDLWPFTSGLDVDIIERAGASTSGMTPAPSPRS